MIAAPAINPMILFFAAIFTSNILLANFLGMCSFIAISRDFNAANGLGAAVILVITISAAINWPIYQYLLVPLQLDYLRFIVFIVVIAAVVQVLEMLIDRLSPALYLALGIYLPLIVANCAVLGVILLLQLRNYDFVQSVVFGFGSGIGWWLAIISLAAIRKKVDASPVPAGLKGSGIVFVTIGLMAMAFIGFSGMLVVQ
jgi:Na+-transporting NADH:ubiquinone oxidoreductase subunit E